MCAERLLLKETNGAGALTRDFSSLSRAVRLYRLGKGDGR